MEEVTEQQLPNSKYAHLKPHQFKPGQSGNPGGRPKGSVSLKEFAKRYLLELNEEEKLEFLAGIDKDKVWEMAEDRAGQSVKADVEVTSKVVKLDE